MVLGLAAWEAGERMASVLVYTRAEGHTGPAEFVQADTVLVQVLEAPADRPTELLEQAGAGTPVVDDGSAGTAAVDTLAVQG